LSAYSPLSNPPYSPVAAISPARPFLGRVSGDWQFFAAASFLVSVPVFLEAPLVRNFPWISLLLSGLWFWGSWQLKHQTKFAKLGDLLWGFSWTWLAGAIYWGWLRWEPLLHLPIEAIALPFSYVSITQDKGRIGHFFYIGSLFGTAVTDIYFYLMNLIPYWRQVMQADLSAVDDIFHGAVRQMQTPWGINWAAMLTVILLTVGCLALRRAALHWWVFSGAVLSTLLVDGLFWLAATAI
jgi:hypothetical protein